MTKRIAPSALALGAAFLMCGPAHAEDIAGAEVYDLTIEQLLNAEVYSVSRRAESLSQAAASIDLITSEDVRRSGAQSLPEVLRLARNLEVAQIDAQRYAISARGFNSFEASNKLLVLIDGRTVYTPLYSGVFWDQQHVLLDNIDRIEVVSGPGGTLWGANAVNGVINIITKEAGDTQGFFADLHAGDVDQRADLRFGAPIGPTGHVRVFASGYAFGPTLDMAGDEANDDWSGAHAGFRADWEDGAGIFMLQGAVFRDDLDAGGGREGGHILGQWTRALADGSSFSVQTYYASEERDAALRATPGTFDSSDTFDFSIQHNTRLGDRHEIVWGAGYRNVDSEFVTTFISAFEQPRRTLETYNVFAQDEIALSEDLALTLGLKLEDHTFTGLEYMPNARLAWRPSDGMMVWGAVSRAVRTPSRIDEELSLPPFTRSFTFESEELLAYELGARLQPTPNSTLSATLFLHDYEGLRTSNTTPPGVFPVFVGNGLEGEVYGLEMWGDIALRDNWRLSAGVTLLEQDYELAPFASDVNGSGDDPGYQVFLRSQADLTPDLALDLNLRAIEENNPLVPSYVDLDARLGWRLNERVEIALSGRNLLDEAHPESFDIAPLLQARRSVHVSARLRY